MGEHQRTVIKERSKKQEETSVEYRGLYFLSTSNLKNSPSLSRRDTVPALGAGESLVLSVSEILRAVYPERSRRAQDDIFEIAFN